SWQAGCEREKTQFLKRSNTRAEVFVSNERLTRFYIGVECRQPVLQNQPHCGRLTFVERNVFQVAVKFNFIQKNIQTVAGCGIWRLRPSHRDVETGATIQTLRNRISDGADRLACSRECHCAIPYQLLR